MDISNIPIIGLNQTLVSYSLSGNELKFYLSSGSNSEQIGSIEIDLEAWNELQDHDKPRVLLQMLMTPHFHNRVMEGFITLCNIILPLIQDEKLKLAFEATITEANRLLGGTE